MGLPIVKHKANGSLNQNICRSQGVGGGGVLHLLLKCRMIIMPISRCKIPPLSSLLLLIVAQIFLLRALHLIRCKAQGKGIPIIRGLGQTMQ